jgi:hypothetical protein
MKTYVHARLGRDERAQLDALKKATGKSESDLVKHGLRLVHERVKGRRSALDAAGRLVGKYRGGPRDLSTNHTHLDDFGR